MTVLSSATKNFGGLLRLYRKARVANISPLICFGVALNTGESEFCEMHRKLPHLGHEHTSGTLDVQAHLTGLTSMLRSARATLFVCRKVKAPTAGHVPALLGTAAYSIVRCRLSHYYRQRIPGLRPILSNHVASAVAMSALVAFSGADGAQLMSQAEAL